MSKHDLSKIEDSEVAAWLHAVEIFPGVTVTVEGTTIKIARTLDGPAPPAPAHQGGPCLFVNVWALDWAYDCWVNAYSGAPVGNPDRPGDHPAFEIISAVSAYRPLKELC